MRRLKKLYPELGEDVIRNALQSADGNIEQAAGHLFEMVAVSES